MDGTMERNNSRKPIQSLTKSIRSLLGFKAHLTPSWVESVRKIIKELPPHRPSSTVLIDNENSNVVGFSEGDGSKMDIEISEIKDDLKSLNAHLIQLNLQRRKALNDYLDLKGNIRVFCRIRPILADEKCGSSRPVIALDSSKVLLKLSETKRKHYAFDRVFHPESSQDQVFSEVEPIIKSALDGYNVCIFAYGQTGTGKTFTMEGKPDCPGLVPRAIEALFKQAQDTNHTFLFTFSMLEIYMGSLRDLLVPQTAKRTDPTTQCLPIKMDPNGGVEIDNLVAIRVNDFNHAKRLYRLGSRFRSTASTNSNETSSRSHCLIRISITCFDAPERRRETNKIWMIDLGGSERLVKTKARGRRLEEGKAINLSLSALGDVISSLQRKNSHIPYRNSKLTQILRDSLGEDSKTIMLVHVSPKEDDLCETVCSLGFATRVRSVHLGSEESSEIQEEKEVAMAELLHQVKDIEYARRNVRKDIEKLNEKLKLHSGIDSLPNEDPEYPYLSYEKTQYLIESKKQNVGKDTEALSLQVPRFMRPTICSQQKVGEQSSKTPRKKQSSTQRKPPYVRAASVTFPLNRSQSECGSDASGFTWKHGIGYESECSHEASECDIKMVIFPEQEKSLNSSVCSISVLGQDSTKESVNKWEDKYDPVKHSPVDYWIHLGKDEPTITHIQGNIPMLDEKIGHKEHKQEDIISMVEKLHHASTIDPENEKSLGHDLKNKDPCNHRLPEKLTADGINGFTLKPSLMTGVAISDSECNQISKIDEANKLSDQCKDSFQQVGQKAESHCLIYEESCEESQKEILTSNIKAILENSDHGDLCGSPQHMNEVVKPALHSMRSRRALFMSNDGLQENPIMPVVDLLPMEQQTGSGIHNTVGENIQVICKGALLGLGIQSIGLGHDFFHGLTC